MIERGNHACFLLESSGLLSVPLFDGDDPPQTRVARLPHFALDLGRLGRNGALHWDLDSEDKFESGEKSPGYQPTPGRKLFMLGLCVAGLILVWVFYFLER